jgi:tRNA(Ile)-lysidine synthase
MLNIVNTIEVNRTEKKFLENIRKQKLVRHNDRVLLAVSGGADSMALLHLFRGISAVLDCQYGVAHCNFSLRGEESNGDEAFVREVCNDLGLDCQVRRFDTAAVSSAVKRSIEETARILRYDFFDEVCRHSGYNLVATAHHSGDQVETVLFNLIRGTAVSGLRGIRARQGRLVRPMLPFSRKEIMDYLIGQGIVWRTDQSNAGEDYDRNFIRNRVIPVIEERFLHKLTPSLQRLAEYSGELETFIETHIEGLTREHQGLDIAGAKLHVGTLRQLSLFERKELYRRILLLLNLPVDSKVLQRIDGQIEMQQGRRVHAGPGVEVIRKEGFLRFVSTGVPDAAALENSFRSHRD